MFKLVCLFLVLCYVNASKDIFYSHILPSYEREYAVVQNTNHRTGEVSDPVTIELRNPKCYPRACDYASRMTTQENIFFVYSHQQRLYTSNRCKLGRDYVVKKVEISSVSCDTSFCLNHGIGIAAVRSCGTEYCECRSTGVAILRSCAPGFVFSPQYMTCDYEHKVYGCVLARRQRK